VAARGNVYAINGLIVTTPDEEVWTPHVMGDALTGRQKRSPYRILEWRKQVADRCLLDWFSYDNTTLVSLTATPPGTLDQHETYTDAICQAVNFRKRLSVGNEIVARFLVCVG